MLYFLETDTRGRQLLLCRWTEFLFEQGQRVHVLTDSTTSAQHLDHLLWSFSQPSFVPHRIFHPDQAADADGPAEPVVITVTPCYLRDYSVLVCDAPAPLDLLKRYPLALHFVLMDHSEQRQESRLLFQQARREELELRHFRQNANLPQ